jgi:hypothetical protein
LSRIFLIIFLLFCTPAWSAEIKKTVCPSGCDYTSLEAAMNGNEQNLTDNGGDTFVVEISGTWSSADTTAVTIHNYTTSATSFINIYTTGSARHQGVWSTSNNYHYISVTGYGATALSVQNSYVTVKGLQLRGSTNSSDGIGLYYGNYVGLLVDSCILTAPGSNGNGFRGAGVSGSGTIINSIFQKSANKGIYFTTYSGTATMNLYSSTLVANGSDGLYDVYNKVTVKNCYSGGNGGSSYSGGILTTSSASDTTGSGGSYNNVAYSISSGAYFTNVTSGSEDLHIGTSSALKDAGTDLGSPYNVDIIGTSRPQGNAWDIGAFEYISSTNAPLSSKWVFDGVSFY